MKLCQKNWENNNTSLFVMICGNFDGFKLPIVCNIIPSIVTGHGIDDRAALDSKLERGCWCHVVSVYLSNENSSNRDRS